MPLALFVTAILIVFGLYSVAPIFGLDEAYPDLFRPYGPLSWAMVGLVVLGALWWGVEKVRRSGLKKDPSPRDAKRDAIRSAGKR